MYQLTHNRINIRRITLEAIHGRPDLYRVSNINPEGQAAKKIMLQNGDILRTVNNIVMQGKSFDDVINIIQNGKLCNDIIRTASRFIPLTKNVVPRPAMFRFSRHGFCVPLPRKIKKKTYEEQMEDLKYERMHRDLLMAREQQEKLKLKAIEERERRKEAEKTSKHVCKQNSELRRKSTSMCKSKPSVTSWWKKMKSKYQKLTKQTQVSIFLASIYHMCLTDMNFPQDAVIQRSLLSTEISRLKAELERNKAELHKSNMSRLNELNTQAVSATVNPQKNEEMKKKLKLTRKQLEQLERATETRRVEDARKAKFLPKRFRKMILKQIISHMRIPYDCITGQPGRGEFSITVENVPDLFSKVYLEMQAKVLMSPVMPKLIMVTVL